MSRGRTVRASTLVAVLASLTTLVSCASRTEDARTSSVATETAAPGTHAHQGGGNGHATPDAPDPMPIRLGPQGAHPQFVVKCPWSHSAPDDPIVWPGIAGASHLHEFFGSTATDASSTGESLEGGSTTCENTADTAAYWVPALYDDGVRVAPHHVVAYYRTGVGVDASDVEPWPLGLKMIAGDAGAESAQSLGVVGWACGSSDHLTVVPRECSSRAPLTLRLTFPDCWDGRDLDSADHRRHVAYSDAGKCPGTHPTPIVQLILAVHYEFHSDPTGLSLASGATTTGHGDVMNGWSRDELAHLTNLCLRRGEICGISSNRTDLDT